jgi:hypothetical protein
MGDDTLLAEALALLPQETNGPWWGGTAEAPGNRAKGSPAEHAPTMLDVCVHHPLSMKSFHGVSAAIPMYAH